MRYSPRKFFLLLLLGLPSLLFIPTQYRIGGIQKTITGVIDLTQIQEDLAWNPMDSTNIWDVTHSNNATRGPSDEYRTKYPFITRNVLMTATGGRPNRCNEYRMADGSYNFTRLDSAIDWILAARVVPSLVLGNVPHDMVNSLGKSPENYDYGAFDALTYAPKNWTEYTLYIANIASHIRMRYGNVEWDVRLMTEPDNTDWWSAGWDTYIKLYIETMKAVRLGVDSNGELAALNEDKGLTKVKLEVGNFADIKFNVRDRLVRLLQQVAGNETVLGIPIRPSSFSFSCYSGYPRLQIGPNPRELEYILGQWREVIKDHPEWGANGKELAFNVEEGMIYQDEQGRKVASGESSELGAAWQAAMVRTCLNANITHFTQWNMGYLLEEIRDARFWMNLLYDQFKGLKMIPIRWSPLAFTESQWIDGIVVSNTSSGQLKICLFNFHASRTYSLNHTIHLQLLNLPAAGYRATGVLIDKTHNNPFQYWYPDLVASGLPLYNGKNDPQSYYDANQGFCFENGTSNIDGWIFRWNWLQEHKYLTAITAPEPWFGISGLIPNINQKMEFSIELRPESVLFINLDQDA